MMTIHSYCRAEEATEADEEVVEGQAEEEVVVESVSE